MISVEALKAKEIIDGREILAMHEIKANPLNEFVPRWIILAVYKGDVITCRMVEIRKGMFEFSAHKYYSIDQLPEAIKNYEERSKREK